jgi:DNA-binding beta-propeller fold protein YncE
MMRIFCLALLALWGPAPNQMNVVVRTAEGPRIAAVAFDPHGTMFLAYEDSSIRVMRPSGHVQKYAHTHIPFTSNGPAFLRRGMAFDSSGNLYVTDGRAVYRIGSDRKAAKWVEGFVDAVDIKSDPRNNVYIVDAAAGAVYRITPSRERSLYIDCGHPIRAPDLITSIEFDRRFENLYLADRFRGQVLRYPIRPDGTPGDPQVAASSLMTLRSIAVDAGGNIFVSMDYPLLVRIDRGQHQTVFPVGAVDDFMIGRLAWSPDGGRLYVPLQRGLVGL